MANYYYGKIIGENVNQNFASELFYRLTSQNLVRGFSYSGNEIKYDIRGYCEIDDLIKKYNINEDNISIKDEFDLVYESFSPEELKQMEEAKKFLEERNVQSSKTFSF